MSLPIKIQGGGLHERTNGISKFRWNCRVGFLILMYTIIWVEACWRIATLVCQSKWGIEPLRHQHTPLEEQLCTKVWMNPSCDFSKVNSIEISTRTESIHVCSPKYLTVNNTHSQLTIKRYWIGSSDKNDDCNTVVDCKANLIHRKISQAAENTFLSRWEIREKKTQIISRNNCN